jgi:C-terminal processing protease CtpA/Prc
MRKLERLDGNIGYFEFLNFTPLSVSKQSLKGAMNFLLYSSAIIVDLRGNGGGYSETLNYLLNYFFKDSVPSSLMRYRNQTQLVRTVIVKDSSIISFPENTPVYILVSNRTSSAAEAFASTLQRYKRAIVIGEQTKGEGNPGNLFAINDDLYIMIPTAEAIDPVTKMGIDFKGVIPDIKIGRDKALTKALLEANSALAAKAERQELRRMYQWQIPLLNNKLNPQPLTETIRNSIVGDYEGGRKIIYETPDIFYISNKGEKEKLNYIGNGIFQNAQKDWVRLVMPFTDKAIPDFEWVYDDTDKPQKVKRIIK